MVVSVAVLSVLICVGVGVDAGRVNTVLPVVELLLLEASSD